MTRTFMVALLVLLGSSPLVEAKDKKPKPVTYIVVDVDGELQTIEAKGFKAFKKQLGTTHKESVKAHAEAKKAAKKAKEKFTEPKPKAPKVKVMSKPLAQEAAQALITKITEDRAKQKDKKKKKT